MRARVVILTAMVTGLGALVLWLGRGHGHNRQELPEPVAPPVAAGQAKSGAPAAAREDSGHTNRTTSAASNLAAIWGGRGESFVVRSKAVHDLGKRLSREEILELYRILRRTDAPPSAPMAGEHVLKNDVMDILLQQNPPPADLMRELCDLYRDTGQDAVTRDYALQHLGTGGSLVRTNFVDDWPAAREVLWAALQEPESSLAGTALLALHKLAGLDAGVDSQRVTAAALKLASETSTGDLSRTTALQVCGLRKAAEALPVAIALARNDGSVALRAAAIATIGDLGGEPEKAFLENLSTNCPPALQAALQGARRALRERLSGEKTVSLNNLNKQ